MMCETCQIRQAAIRIKMMINNDETREMKLCSQCYQEVKGQGAFSANFSSFDDIWKEWLSKEQAASSIGANSKQSAPVMTKAENGFLDKHGRNLTNEARNGKLDPVIGRSDEIERVIEILNRRTKNNPVLIGEAGVGKTAIVEGFALQIVEGNVPSKLKAKEVYTLDMSSLVAGTQYRGAFEEKLEQLITELQSRPNVILFIDEIHMVVGAGATGEGSMDAGNILKPALARGDIQIVGATTLKEYRQIEKDPALERRFQPVIIKEPGVTDAIDILKGIRPLYETYHEVKYSDEVLRACVELSHRYIQDRFLPDKAIDLMDEAGAKLNLLAEQTDFGQLKMRLAEIAKEKKLATIAEDYEKAAQLRDEEKIITDNLSEQSSIHEVTVANIQAIIEKRTGIPISKLEKAEQKKLKNLEQSLQAKIIAQEEAVKKVAKAIRRARAGLKPKSRPTASFLFVGPTGTGKTELAKRLAEELFGSKEKMIRLDMSEYMEKHAVSKLIGSPPGYVGHEEAGQLTERVRRNPYSIILLDEIEKAHPDVTNMFLQIMEDGRLTDSQGKVVNFNETVIIMTSNAGTTSKKKSSLGFGTTDIGEETHLLDTLSDYFKPEFLNRFDAIIPFAHLEKDDLVQIVDLMLADLHETLAARGITLEVTDEVKLKLAELGYHPAFGARPLRRVIQDQIEDKLTDALMEDEDVVYWTIQLKNNEIYVTS